MNSDKPRHSFHPATRLLTYRLGTQGRGNAFSRRFRLASLFKEFLLSDSGVSSFCPSPSIAGRRTKSGLVIRRSVFWPAVLFILLCVGLASVFPNSMARLFSSAQDFIAAKLSWFYILAVAIILCAMTLIAVSRFGSIRLGPDHVHPAFSLPVWFAMLFSTGMGIGIMFFGIAEPVMHFLAPPEGEAQTVAAARSALETTFFHWGLHAWAIYAAVGLMLAYFGFRRGLPLTLRSALYPLIGERIYGPIGDAADVFAVTGTVFGVATSLGFGVLQINSGLGYLFGVSTSTSLQMALIFGISALSALSAASGLNRGIKLLSEANLILAVLLLALVFAVGPTAELLKHFVENTGIYLSGLITKTFTLYAYEPQNTEWLGGWTLQYWGWWISWSPFVGLFIAQISRGRTIREFLAGVLLIPAGFTLLWMTAFGNSAIDLIMSGTGSALAAAVSNDVSTALYKFFEYLPGTPYLCAIGMGMVIVFFRHVGRLGRLRVRHHRERRRTPNAPGAARLLGHAPGRLRSRSSEGGRPAGAADDDARLGPSLRRGAPDVALRSPSVASLRRHAAPDAPKHGDVLRRVGSAGRLARAPAHDRNLPDRARCEKVVRPYDRSRT